MGLLLDLLPQEEREHILKLIQDAGGNGRHGHLVYLPPEEWDDEEVLELLVMVLAAD